VKCSTIRTRLTALLDAELSAHVATRVRTHLETCPYCAQALEEERLLRAQAAVWSVEVGDVWERVREEIRAQSEREALAEILTEMRRLQAEVRALHGEVASLRAQLSVHRQEERPSGPSPLLPYATDGRSTFVLM
jgi:anti-sigma factor RsiW